MNITLDVSGAISFNYNPESPEFKEALESYRESVGGKGAPVDMLKHVAFYITRFGAESMIEGVGYIKANNRIQGEPYSGIEVEEGYDDFYFED